MKLFRKICIWLFAGMAGLASGILFFLLSAVPRQSIKDAALYGEREIGGKVSAVRERVQSGEPGGTAVRDAVILHEFRQVFGTDSVLWKEGEEIRNGSPSEFDRDELSRRFGEEGLRAGEIYVSGTQRVGERFLLVFYQEGAALGAEGYSLAVYRDVTDIYARVWRLFLIGLGYSAVLFCGVGAVLYWGVRRTLAPLEELRRASAGMAEGEYGSAIPVTGRDEIGEVTESFNRMAEKIREHMETLEEVNERQRQLLGGLSHEMKTPMTAIIGNAEMLLTLQLKDREREKALFHILNEARRLARLSEKMMEFSRLYEDLGSVIVMKRQKIGKVLEQLEALTAFRLAEKRICLKAACVPDGLEKTADEDLLLSLLWNLVENAYKASEPGGSIEVRAEGGSLLVRDFGKGIPPGEIGRVTEAFYMVDKSRSRKAGGVGLGLALCSRIAEIHGWSLRIESRVGEGTEISVLW